MFKRHLKIHTFTCNYKIEWLVVKILSALYDVILFRINRMRKSNKIHDKNKFLLIWKLFSKRIYFVIYRKLYKLNLNEEGKKKKIMKRNMRIRMPIAVQKLLPIFGQFFSGNLVAHFLFFLPFCRFRLAYLSISFEY